MTIGDAIRAARKARGLTQTELAHAMGITGAAIGQYETGIRTPKHETVARIAHALSVPICSLVPDFAPEIKRLTDRCARYAEEIAVLQERTRWIPVDERLPEEGVPVLINYIGTDGEPYADGVAVWTECGCFWWEGSLADCDEEVAVPVTYWMPLPDGPEVTG